MAAGPTAVGHDGRGCATAVAYGGRSALPNKTRKLARKYHKNSEKKKERFGKEKRVRGQSSEALPVLRFIVSISSISTHLAPLLRKRN
jgi:hypothetical protein